MRFPVILACGHALFRKMLVARINAGIEEGYLFSQTKTDHKGYYSQKESI